MLYSFALQYLQFIVHLWKKKTSWINFELEQRVYLSKFKLYSLLQTLFGEKFGND